MGIHRLLKTGTAGNWELKREHATGQILDFYIYELQQRHPGVALCSAEFLLQEKHTADRSIQTLYKDFAYHTTLDALLRFCITDSEREALFPGFFDLGSRREIPEHLRTQRALANELGLDVDSNPLDSVREGVERLFADKRGRGGSTLSQFIAVDSNRTLKAVKLLYHFLNYRHHRLFGHLKFPTQRRYSLEFRSHHPYDDDAGTMKSVAYLIADMKVLFGLELSDTVYVDEIHVPFRLLPHQIDTIINEVADYLLQVVGPHSKVIPFIYRQLGFAVESLVIEPKSASVPLDEAMCRYVHVLEFAHLTIGFSDLALHAPRCELNSCVERLYRFTVDLKGQPVVSIAEGLWTLDDAPQAMVLNVATFMELMCSALGTPVTLEEFERAIPIAQALIHNYAYVRHGDLRIPLVTDIAVISAWDLLGALCCAWHADQHPPPLHAPYWRLRPETEGLGAPKPTSSLRVSLKRTYDMSDGEAMSWEHRVAWQLRLDGFRYGVVGQSETCHQRQQLKVTLMNWVTATMEVDVTQDVRFMLDKLRMFIEQQCAVIVMHAKKHAAEK